MSLKFKRTIEDFVCSHCGAHIRGDGYTNHCPKCLWSRHVDIFPGDRSNKCRGMMEPIRLESVKDEFEIVHRCKRCGEERRVKTVGEDNLDALLKPQKGKF